MEDNHETLAGIAQNSSDIKTLGASIEHMGRDISASVDRLIAKIDEQNTKLLDKALKSIPLDLFIYASIALIGLFAVGTVVANKINPPHANAESAR